MEEGSSGSGLFNTSGHLIGMCSAGAPYEVTCTDTNFVGKEMNNYALYGKLARDWAYTFETPSTPQTRLKDWLDPANTGLTKIDAIPASCDSTTGSATAGKRERNGQYIPKSYRWNYVCVC